MMEEIIKDLLKVESKIKIKSITKGANKMNEQIKIDLKELEKFLEYLQDKVEDCYQKETEEAIRNFLQKK